ncbi:hypothetical protein GCM10009111_35030 [Colwellia asteriadis]|uniref:Uncharacterized protein n=1 Tax=Colwellia asteriadis TaxID=517723 RepID=A0ABN1LBJ2_9GAMM
MSYFIKIHQCQHDTIKQTLINKDVVLTQEQLDEHQSALDVLFAKSYTRDPETHESETACELLYALEVLCEAKSTQSDCITFYLDDDYPLMVDFLFNDWDVADDFTLPLSPHGTPAVVYRDSKSLSSYITAFQDMLDNEAYDEDFIEEHELVVLINSLSCARQNNCGVFVFCFQ